LKVPEFFSGDLLIFVEAKKQPNMQKSQTGIDSEAFEVLFKTYFKALVNFSNTFLKDIEAAKEVVHEVFAKMWEKRAELDPDKPLKSYLYTAVNNRSLNYIRDHKKFTNNDTILENEPQSVQNDLFTQAEIQRIIEFSISELSPKVRRVFEMSRYEDKKYREIAEELNISQKTVESHIAKALNVLRENLKEYLSLIIMLLLR
jgi:RNA polymerase sigma-70 factor (ECF subfamily)